MENINIFLIIIGALILIFGVIVYRGGKDEPTTDVKPGYALYSYAINRWFLSVILFLLSIFLISIGFGFIHL